MEQKVKDRIIDAARDILARIGVRIESEPVQQLLLEHGAIQIGARLSLPAALIDRSLATAPEAVGIYDRDSNLAMDLSADKVHFNPGSTALFLLDFQTSKPRRAVSADLIAMARLTDALPGFAGQSTSLVPDDVPAALADRLRLYLSLFYGHKPVVTGVFTADGLAVMLRLLETMRGDAQKLREKPLAIFDCCPTSPLGWSALSADALTGCARAGIPAEIVPMILAGGTGAADLSGALVQHCAEALSGVVIAQCAQPGAPVIWGGASTTLEMRYGTAPSGAVESMRLACAYSQIGKALGLPTHAYACLSDAKQVDAQAGMESGMGALIAARSGINNISGPGLLDFINCISFEKLILDHEICRMALDLVQPINLSDGDLAPDLGGDLDDGELFLTSPHTLRHLRETYRPAAAVIDRKPYALWEKEGSLDIIKRAHLQVEEMLKEPPQIRLSRDQVKELFSIMKKECERHAYDLPCPSA